MLHIVRIFFLAGIFMVGAAFISANKADASEPKMLSAHGDWAAYSFSENGKKVCYMASKPKSAKGNYTRRGDIFALITHRPGENSKDVFSYITGYSYKSGSDVTIEIDGKRFTLFTHKDMAWTNTSQDDTALSEAIRRGSKMVVKGRSSRGTLTTDTFSLKGTGAAYKAISSACGY